MTHVNVDSSKNIRSFKVDEVWRRWFINSNSSALNYPHVGNYNPWYSQPVGHIGSMILNIGYGKRTSVYILP